MKKLNDISGDIIHAAIEVHKALGPGLLESVYQKCLVIELLTMGYDVKTEVKVPVKYRGQDISGDAYRLDIIVNDVIIIELKSVEEVKKVNKKQLQTYLKLMNKELGLLINFNVVLLKDGITREVNNFME